MYQDLLEKKKSIAVVGLGYVGLPLALVFAKKFKVIGFDINQKRIEAINYLLKTHNATIEVFDMLHENGDAKGTKVIIKLPLKYDE